MSTLKVNTITPNSGDTVTISGSLTTTGKLTIGDASTDTVAITAEISSSIIPDATNTYDLGSPTKVWREIYVSSESLNFVDGAGNSTKFTKDNVDKIKSGKPIATIGGFESSTRTKAIFQDDDETTYKKLTVPGRIGQFISGTLVKDYNKSGSNSYVKKDGIDVYEWNSAKSMSFNSTHSFWNVENMSMDISEGGFYGLAVSGSTLASNLHNMANNTSGLFLTGSNVIVSGSTSLSGSTVFQGGDTTVSQSTDDTLIISGGNIQFEVGDVTSSFEITGSEGDTLNVSGGNVVFSSSFSQSGDAVFEGGTTTINGTAQTQSLIVSGGQIQFEVEDSGSSFEITGSEGDTLNVSGGNVVITSEFTQSGESVFEEGINIFEGSASFDPSSSIEATTNFVGDTGSLFSSGSTSGSEYPTVSISGPSGSGELVVDQISVGWDNDIPITASLTLSNADHGMGRQLLVCSGSNPLHGIDQNLSMNETNAYYGMPVSAGTNPLTGFPGGGQHRHFYPSAIGVIRLELPSASVGMSFNIICKQRSTYDNTFYYAPSILVTPNGSEKFLYNTTGSAGVLGKGINMTSQSMQHNARLHVTCQSGSDWSIVQMNGPWTDEAY